jgi:hypothetical protein
MDSVTGSTETLFNAASGIGNAVASLQPQTLHSFLRPHLTDGGFQLTSPKQLCRPAWLFTQSVDGERSCRPGVDLRNRDCEPTGSLFRSAQLDRGRVMEKG